MSKKIKSQYIPEQLALGASIEMEHTDNPAVAMKIAMQHLNEDKHYYTKLAKMEAKFAEGGTTSEQEKKYLTAKRQFERYQMSHRSELAKPKDLKVYKTEDEYEDAKEKAKPVDADFDLSKALSGEEDEFANGGSVVKGNKFAGDTIDAKINSGEMILNLEQQQRLLDLIRSQKPEFAEGGVNQIFKKQDFVSSKDAENYLNKLRTAHTTFAAKEAAGDATSGLLKDVVGDKIGKMTSLLKSAGKFAIGAGVLKAAMGPEAAIASEVLGSEDVGAGSDTLTDKPNYKEIDAINKQLATKQAPSAFEPKMANGGRVDEQVDNGQLDVNKDQQKRLMDLLRGDIELDSLGCDNIVGKPHFANGFDGTNIPDTAYDIPNTIAAPANPVVSTPIDNAPLNITSPSVDNLNTANVGLPDSMQYTGPGSNVAPIALPTPELPPVAPAVVAPPIIPATPPVINTANALPTPAELAAEQGKLDGAVKEQQRIAKQAVTIQQKNQEQVAEAMKAADDKIAEVSKANSSDSKDTANQKAGVIDPNRFWNDKSTPEKIFTHVRILLSGIGGGMTGRGGNLVLDQINKTIDNDIAAQKANIETSLAKKRIAQEDLVLKLKGIALNTDSAEKKNAAEMAIAKIGNASAQTLKDLQRAIMLRKGQALPPPLRTPEETTRVDSLRKEYEGIVGSTGARKVLVNYEQLKDATNNPSGPGDISMIYNFMKSLDPTSTVREGEYATAKNAGPKAMMLERFYNKLVSGQMLTQEDRNKFLETAQRLASSAMREHNDLNNTYTKIARAANLPDNEIVTLQIPPELQSSPTKSKREQFIELQIRNGKTEEQAAAAADKLLSNNKLTDKYAK